MKSKVIAGGKLLDSRKSFYNDLNKFSSSINQSAFSLLGHNSLIEVGWSDCFRVFIESFKDNDSSIKNLVLASLHKLNSVNPNVIELYIRTLSGEEHLGIQERKFRVGSKSVIEDLVKNHTDNFIQNNIAYLIQSAELAGSLGTVSVEVRDSIRNPLLVLEEGFRSDCVLDEFFLPYLDSFEIENCKIIMVDGKVIDVSEIHHILQSSYETKQPFLLITTGLSEDVSNTLLVNWEQGKTKVIPFQINDKVESVNEMKDISVVSGTEACSDLNGIRVSSIDLEKIPELVVRYSSEKGALSIIPDESSSERISRLRNQIRKKINDSNVDDVKDILSKRMSKLCLRNVVLELPGSSVSSGIIKDKTSSFFSHISGCAGQGVVDARKYFYSDYHLQLLPYSDADLAIKRAVSDRNAIHNIKAIVKLEST